MQTQLAPEFRHTPDGELAESILRKCVHCGFCTATCPTYQLLGDELDGPRGRIYLIKQVLEGHAPTRHTQAHLDRCLTCRNCESTCPSGVDYGQLLDVGRKVVESRVTRPVGEQAVRWLLKTGLNSPLFAPAMRVGQAMREWLPDGLKAKVPVRQDPGAWPNRSHERKVLLPAGCVQPAMYPQLDAATARIFDAAGIETLYLRNGSCCGAVRHHLNDQVGSLDQIRSNIDRWWPYLEGHHGYPVEGILSNASGCGVMIKDYGHLLRHDPAYAAKAERISAATRDASEWLPDLLPHWQTRLAGLEKARPARRLAYHPPCTLQHGQGLRGGVEQHLTQLGLSVQLAPVESHLCCGSAGTYSVLQPTLSQQLRDRKLAQLQPLQADAIVSANVGCLAHLQSGTDTPVVHWIEVVDDLLQQAAAQTRTGQPPVTAG